MRKSRIGCSVQRKTIVACGVCLLALVNSVWGQDRPPRSNGSPPTAEPSDSPSQSDQPAFEEIVVPVPNMAAAGRILREVSIAKAQEGIPANDGNPRFDTEQSKLYFRTTPGNVEAMRRILTRIESGAPAIASKPVDSRPLARSSSGRIYTIEFWLLEVYLPKGESLELSGPRGEVLTTIAGLEKEDKATLLNHIYLTAEEGKAAQSSLNEMVTTLTSTTTMGGGLGGRRPEDGAGGPPRTASSYMREALGAKFKVTVMGSDSPASLLDYSISKTFIKPEPKVAPGEAPSPETARPSIQMMEIESMTRAPFGKVITASSQMRGGDKPSEIRVLVLVNPL